LAGSTVGQRSILMMVRVGENEALTHKFIKNLPLEICNLSTCSSSYLAISFAFYTFYMLRLPSPSHTDLPTASTAPVTKSTFRFLQRVDSPFPPPPNHFLLYPVSPFSIPHIFSPFPDPFFLFSLRLPFSCFSPSS
jgi:hypothetical protein